MYKENFMLAMLRFIANPRISALLRKSYPNLEHCEVYLADDDQLKVVRRREDHGVNGTWLHVLVSRFDRDPTWEEILATRDEFFTANAYVVQILPPAAEYVNLHTHGFHLWARVDQPTIPPDIAH